MSDDQINAILRKTLDDFRVSRGERRIIQSMLKELDANEHRLAVIRSQAFDIARAELLSPEAKGVLDWLEDIVKLLQPQPPDAGQPSSRAFFSPGGDCLRQIVKLLGRVRQRAEICVFTITDDRISDAILDARQRNADVRIITDNDKAADLGSDVDHLARCGVRVKVDQSEYHMHHKFAIFDGRILATGSYNWTRSAADRNEENLVVTDDAALTRQFSRVFEEMWQSLD